MGSDTDVLAQAPPWLKWVGWFVEKVGIPTALLFAVIYFLGTEMKTMNAKLDRVVNAIENKLPNLNGKN